MRSPKDKFRGKICFNEPVKGIGSEVMVTANSVEQIISYADVYKKHDFTLYISENEKVYPEFDWVLIEKIKHTAE